MKSLSLCLASALGFGHIVLLSGAPFRVEGLCWAESAALSPDGQFFVIGHTDGSVSCLNATDGTVLRRWPANGNNQVDQLSFSADGSRVLTVSPNRVYRVLDLNEPNGAEVAKWVSKEYFPGGGISPDGNHVLTVAHKGPLRWYDAATGQIVREWTDTADKTEGYSSAVVLENDGLAVVAPMQYGTAALVDAANGEVLARLIGGDGKVEPLPNAQGVSWGRVSWSRRELNEARQIRPAAPLQGKILSTSLGWLGRAMQRALPWEDWIFWAKKNGTRTGIAWLEPSWPQLRIARAPNRMPGPVVADGTHRRIWWQENKGAWVGWSMEELGQPDGLAIGGYSRTLTPMKSGLLMIADVNGMQACIEPLAMRPLATRQLEVRASGTYSKEQGVCVDVQWSPESGWREGWAKPDPNIGWSLNWTDENGRQSFKLSEGVLDSAPRFSHGPTDIAAVLFAHSYQEKIGATQMRRSALRLWDEKANRWLPTKFDDHREAAVSEVRWSNSGRWLGSSNFTERDGPRTVRVWSLPEGRRFGQPIEGAACWAIGDDGSLAWTDRDGQVYLREADGITTRHLGGPNAVLRSARVAISSDGTHLALLTGDNLLVVLATEDGKELHRESLAWWPQSGWESPSGDLTYVNTHTVAVLTSREAWFRLVRY